MLRILTILLLSLSTACVTVQSKDDDEYMDITDILKPSKPKVITKVVREGSGCPPMTQVKLIPTPAAPKAALSRLSENDYKAMDNVLLKYIKQLRSTNEQNIARVRSAIAENNRKCKR